MKRFRLDVAISLPWLTMFATPGAAECAWVLCTTLGKPEATVTSVTDAFPTRGERLVAKRTRLESILADQKRQNPERLAFATCLPDTVDPRGSKGK